MNYGVFQANSVLYQAINFRIQVIMCRFHVNFGLILVTSALFQVILVDFCPIIPNWVHLEVDILVKHPL